MDQFNYINDLLSVENLSIQHLANTFETPFYVYSHQQISHNYTKLDTVLSNLNAQICYAVKANSNQAILAQLAAMGSGADVVRDRKSVV